MRDPRVEADERTGGRFDVRVLEPSPPAVVEAPWFADDPVHRPGPTRGAEVVAPVPGLGGRTWADVAAGEADLAAWCADRWLGPWRRLGPLPDAFDVERARLHLVAQDLSAVRTQATGKLGLRWVLGGFGTPFLPDGTQRAATDVGLIGDLFGFATSVLEELRVRWSSVDETRVQLWPEHFDVSIDCGANRATYGVSPGDEGHPEPYLYVAPWERRTGTFWRDPHFGGAALPYDDLLAADDQRATAIEFFTTGWDHLHP